ncbi:TATA element modulatory factor-like isoform X2 [Gigantopelta aegis]|uniref:TATA element modulatory factor-like isoform X2 n=1 Tax=Gigantopelta aegis TaxID=1735272 RepID=UPI001B88BB9F|nr:TATA element modulatory factor-like isoform X2 [Gigantopelta aegis]
MSWWDATGFSSFATQVVKNAQKKIDKVLDIDGLSDSQVQVSATAVPASVGKPKSEEKDFWNAWLPAGSTKSIEEAEDSSGSESRTGRDLSKTSSPETTPRHSSPYQSKFPEPSSLGTKSKPDVSDDAGSADDAKQDKEEKSVSQEESSSWSFGWNLGSADGEDKAKPKISSWSDFPSGKTRDRGDKGPNRGTGKQNRPGARNSPRTPLSSSSSVSSSAETEVQEKSEHDVSRLVTASDLSDLPGTVKTGEAEARCQKNELVVDECVARGDAVETHDTHDDKTTVCKESDLIVCPDSKQPDEEEDLLLRAGEDSRSEERTSDSGADSDFLNVNLKDECPQQEKESSSSNLPENIIDSKTVIDETSASIKDSQNSFCDFSFGSIPDSSSGEMVRSSNSTMDDASGEGAASQQPADDESFPISDAQQLQIQVDATVSMSTSESSILTLSSPGQDELLLEGQNSQEPIVRSVDSDYLNISTSGPAMISVQSLSSALSTVSIQSFSSDQSVSSVKELADVSAEPRSADKEMSEQTDTDHSNENDSSDTSKLDSSMDTCTSGDTVLEKADHEDSGGENEKSNDNLPCVSLNGSYVKCMLEDAMEEKPEDSCSDHHSTGEKSESSKFESEGDKSVSGHESSDDIETTTSSDIEIISTPNGDSYVKPFDLSPLRIALQKTASHSGHLHRRSDSQSSGSTYSKAGESDQMSPGRDSLERQDQESGDEDRSGPELCAVHEESSDSPYHPQKLLQKLAEKEEILQHREHRLVQLSKENNDLLEANSILRNQLQQMEELRDSEMADLNTLTEEFTKRLSESEHKTQTVLREKESIKQQLETTQRELTKRSADVNLHAVLAEKDEIIAELRQEGEKLSKQQLQSNTIIKKLRAKEKENDALITGQKTKLETLTKEVEHLRKVCSSKEDLEVKQTEAINQLNLAIQKQMKETETLKGELEEAYDKARSLQVTLDGSYKEIAELHRLNAAQDSKAQEAALSASLHVREELEMSLEKEKQRFKYEKEALIVQIEDLRLAMTRAERDHNRREDMLRQEISHLQQQLQEDEARNQELAQAVSSATKPLLRQIENLQSTYSAQSQSWEKVDRSLTERLGDVQNQLAFSVEKERTANENVMTLTTRVTALDSQCSRLRQEKAQLSAQAEMDKANIEMLEDAKHSELAQVEAVRNQMSKEMTEVKKQKVFLETQLEMEKTKLESEKRKVTILEEQLRILEKERPQSRGTPSPVSVSRTESVTSLHDQPYWFTTLPQEEMLERGLVLGSPNGSKVNLYESLRHSGAATILENLQSQLKQREGEIVQLQSDIADLERTRESMARELVSLTNQNEELKEQLQEVPALQEKLQDINQRYHALLQMYGEKVEQAEELKLDLVDVKEMYKAQIDQLLAK